jgi:tetratricopeptide (TPR) repeat protein
VVALEAYTGSVENVMRLRDSMKGYEKISDDFQYRNLLLVAELYKQGQYRASSILAREVYDKRPDYYANLKILGFSLYELGRYEEAKNLLEDYYRENPKDIDVIYVLGEIAFFLHDPLTSNMYLNNAVTGGYSKKTDIERRMAYNYYTLMDIDGMVKVLGYLIAEPDATEDDFSIATYVSVTQGDSERALTWVDDGIAKFPQSDRLYALRARALRTLGRLDEAEMSAQQAYVLDGTNALAMLELGYIRASHHSYADARDFLTRMLEVSGDSTFADEAQALLADIENQENSQVEASSLVSEEENLPASAE